MPGTGGRDQIYFILYHTTEGLWGVAQGTEEASLGEALWEGLVIWGTLHTYEIPQPMTVSCCPLPEPAPNLRLSQSGTGLPAQASRSGFQYGPCHTYQPCDPGQVTSYPLKASFSSVVTCRRDSTCWTMRTGGDGVSGWYGGGFHRWQLLSLLLLLLLLLLITWHQLATPSHNK